MVNHGSFLFQMSARDGGISGCFLTSRRWVQTAVCDCLSWKCGRILWHRKHWQLEMIQFSCDCCLSSSSRNSFPQLIFCLSFSSGIAAFPTALLCAAIGCSIGSRPLQLRRKQTREQLLLLLFIPSVQELRTGILNLILQHSKTFCVHSQMATNWGILELSLKVLELGLICD